MNRFQRNIKQLVLAGVIAAASFLAVPATTQAKVGCYGAGCRGRDPQTMGCARDAVTLASRFRFGFQVELRYSRACNAKWGRTMNIDNAHADAVFALVGTGKTTLRSKNGFQVWSLMGTGKLAACGGGNYGNPAYLVCTAAQ
jgi:Protein of unknown function (DUF2690)